MSAGHSVPILAEIEALLLANLHAVLPKSLLGQALHYLASQWGKVRRYVEDGRYSIDNNVEEVPLLPLWAQQKPSPLLRS